MARVTAVASCHDAKPFAAKQRSKHAGARAVLKGRTGRRWRCNCTQCKDTRRDAYSLVQVRSSTSTHLSLLDRSRLTRSVECEAGSWRPRDLWRKEVTTALEECAVTQPVTRKLGKASVRQESVTYELEGAGDTAGEEQCLVSYVMTTPLKGSNRYVRACGLPYGGITKGYKNRVWRGYSGRSKRSRRDKHRAAYDQLASAGCLLERDGV